MALDSLGVALDSLGVAKAKALLSGVGILLDRLLTRTSSRGALGISHGQSDSHIAEQYLVSYYTLQNRTS